MSGPMTMYLYIHDAILREVDDMEARARELNRDDPDEIAAFKDQYDLFHNLVKVHEKSEEDFLFPALNERIAFVAETYLYDHNDSDEHIFADIAAAFDALAHASGNGDRKAAARNLWREKAVLNEMMRLHISKENELMMPHFETEFDLSEQAEMAGAMAGSVDPQTMGQFVAWMYGGQTAQDREGMIRFLQMILPPEAFGGMTGMLKGLGDAEWAEMEKRIPDLADG